MDTSPGIQYLAGTKLYQLDELGIDQKKDKDPDVKLRSWKI